MSSGLTDASTAFHFFIFIFYNNVSIIFYSPNKTEFIKAKYQMLAYVHRLPCREDDSVTAKDLSKVGSSSPPSSCWDLRTSKVRQLWEGKKTSEIHLSICFSTCVFCELTHGCDGSAFSNCIPAFALATWRLASDSCLWGLRPTSSIR